MTALAVLCLLVGVAILIRRAGRGESPAGRAPAGPPASAVAVVRRAGEGRPYYRFSVIPGGVFDGVELAAALGRDPAAARHYAVFHRDRVKPVSSPFGSPVYVSYRIGDAIYWTSKPVRLNPGETLLTDGSHYARARCGNRVELLPQSPVRAGPPSAEELDQRAAPPPTLLAPALVDMLPLPADLSAGILPLLLSGLSEPVAPGTAAVAPGVPSTAGASGAAASSSFPQVGLMSIPENALPLSPVEVGPGGVSFPPVYPPASPSSGMCCEDAAPVFASSFPPPAGEPSIDFFSGPALVSYAPAVTSAIDLPFPELPWLPPGGLSAGPGAAPSAGGGSSSQSPSSGSAASPLLATPAALASEPAAIPPSTPEPSARLAVALALAGGWLRRRSSRRHPP